MSTRTVCATDLSESSDSSRGSSFLLAGAGALVTGAVTGVVTAAGAATLFTSGTTCAPVPSTAARTSSGDARRARG